MSGVDKAALIAEADALTAQLKRAARAKQEAMLAEGRPFDRDAFMQGRDLDVRYENGPAFKPYPFKPTLLSLTLGVSFREWGWTLAGAAVVYGTAFKYAPSLRSRFSPHRLGVVMALPAAAIGYSFGLKSALARHQGMAPNGNPTLIPGYDADSTVPYFMRHKISPARRDFVTGPVQREAGSPGASAAVDPLTAQTAREVYRVLSKEQGKSSSGGPLA